MTDQITVIFLGVNDAGMAVYDWLCDRDKVFVHSLLTTRDQLSVIEEVEPDYVVSCGFRHIVPQDILEVPAEGCLNLHPSLLPYNRGANPNVWSIIDETPAGVTLHYMDTTLDTGETIAQREVKVDFSDSGKELHKRLEDAQYDLFVDIWPAIESGYIDSTPQDPNAGTYHTTDEFDELCELDPNDEYTVKELLDLLRALTFPPYNNAKITLDDGTYYVDVDIRKA